MRKKQQTKEHEDSHGHVFCGYWNASKVGLHKGKYYSGIQIHRENGNIWFCVERETQHWFQFSFSLN